ncbi:septum formation family protein [Streptoverticillium reticulum]|uniref:septum formation family protein n=1 Tax=Streptoverticillium reticulum TaxID=1433415 RepID=UPI0039BF6B9A
MGGALTALVSVALGTLTVMSSQVTTDAYAGTVPTVDQKPGTCHFFLTDQQMVQPSDIGAPVSCERPHQAETFARKTVTGPLARSSARPDPEQLAVDLCHTDEAGQDLRNYLGQDDVDVIHGMSVWTRIPTRAEWELGVRTVRCDLVGPRTDDHGNTLVTHTWKDYAKTKAGAEVRLCMIHGAETSCARTHTWEAVNAAFTLSGRYDAERLAKEAKSKCAPFVEKYLSGTDAANSPRIPDESEWNKGQHVVKCGVSPADGKPAEGTLKGGLTR